MKNWPKTIWVWPDGSISRYDDELEGGPGEAIEVVARSLVDTVVGAAKEAIVAAEQLRGHTEGRSERSGVQEGKEKLERAQTALHAALNNESGREAA